MGRLHEIVRWQMTEQTKDCMFCAHRRFVERDGIDCGLRCTLGHKPRFYTDSGTWKRRCGDYQQGKHVRNTVFAGMQVAIIGPQFEPHEFDVTTHLRKNHRLTPNDKFSGAHDEA